MNVTFGDFEVIIVDEKAKECFSANEVQFFPVQIAAAGASEDKYFIMTIINEIDCLNKSLSKFDLYEENDEIRPDLAGDYKTIYKMVIDKHKVNNVDIFRLTKYNVAIIISEALKKKLERQFLKGFKLKQV